MNQPIIAALVVLALLVAPPGCDDAADDGGPSADAGTDSDSDSGGDADSDADTDADSDGDTDADGDADSVSCDGLPATCDDIGSGWDELTFGCCWNNTVYWCAVIEEEWALQSQDCDEFEMLCAYSEADGYVWCVD